MKNFLQTALPISGGFPNWRAAVKSDNEKKTILDKLNWPLESILYSVKNSEYWNKYWGTHPKEFDEKALFISSSIASAPELIPIYLHRYIPVIPNQKNLPIFSVYGIDIIPYGRNLPDYLAKEFDLELSSQFYTYLNEMYEVPFWSNFDH